MLYYKQMFTGIVEQIGVVTLLTSAAQGGKLTVAIGQDFLNLKLGESVAINGVCLTVVVIKRRFLEFDLSLETLKHTTLGVLKIGERVNLERAMLINGRLGGHLVTGHIDGVGEVRKKIIFDNKGFELYLSLPSDLLRYLIPKGSIAVDGISLTVADLREDLLVIAVIPHTARATTLGSKNVGDRVNLEIDILSKYIERHLAKTAIPGINQDMLDRVGFFPMGWIDN